MFDDVPLPGCLVPSGKRTDRLTEQLRCHGLLFADDLVALASDLVEMQALCVHITSWCRTNEMQVGIHKCGIMEFAANDLDGFQMEELLPNAALQAPLLLCEQAIPLVESYPYLGIMITKSLSLLELIAPRLESGRGTVGSLAPFLSCPIIPMSSRWVIVQVVVLPRLLYGAEIYGMCRVLTDAMQRLLNFALRCVLGIPRWRGMSSLLLWKEMRMKPICAIAAGRRARAYSKCFGLKTWINKLVNKPLQIRKWTWVTGTPSPTGYLDVVEGLTLSSQGAVGRIGWVRNIGVEQSSVERQSVGGWLTDSLRTAPWSIRPMMGPKTALLCVDSPAGVLRIEDPG
jgi:hypothetical protein